MPRDLQTATTAAAQRADQADIRTSRPVTQTQIQIPTIVVVHVRGRDLPDLQQVAAETTREETSFVLNAAETGSGCNQEIETDTDIAHVETYEDSETGLVVDSSQQLVSSSFPGSDPTPVRDSMNDPLLDAHGEGNTRFWHVSSVEILKRKKQRMTLVGNADLNSLSTNSITDRSFPSSQQSLSVTTPSTAPSRRNLVPRVGFSLDQMTPSHTPSLESSDDERELELSVGRMGLLRGSSHGGNSPQNEKSMPSSINEKEVVFGGDAQKLRNRSHQVSAEDREVLERAAMIMRGQVQHFEDEINANISQQVKELYKDSLDPPDLADLDSLPDFHIRNNPHAPVAIVKAVQVCCAIERGLNAVLGVQAKRDGSSESLMEICVKRPVVMAKAMDGAVNGMQKTLNHGAKRRGSSVEWKK